ncbi:MAG: HAD-IIB family hydrolase [Anaerolineae bacterium]|nr:HAD-IIB family hydrolase [Anaerolineae bacterium]
MTQQTTNPIQLIVADLDGTLLNSQQQLTERTEKALKAALAKGVQVMLATGKTFTSGRKLVEKLGLTTPGIYNQGTVAYNADGSLRFQHTLTPSLCRQVITFAEDRGYQVTLYCGNRILSRSTSGWLKQLHSKYEEPMPEAVGSLQNVLDTVPVNKILVVAEGDARRIKALRWQLGMQINGTARLMQTGVNEVLEILPPGVSKGLALKALLKELKSQPARCWRLAMPKTTSKCCKPPGLAWRWAMRSNR